MQDDSEAAAMAAERRISRSSAGDFFQRNLQGRKRIQCFEFRFMAAERRMSRSSAGDFFQRTRA